MSPARCCIRRCASSLVALLLAAVAVLALSACQGPTDGDGELPNLGDLESRVTPITLPESAQLTRGPRAQMVVQQVEMPLHVSLASAWEAIDESALPALSRGVWRANGLRVGIIRREAITAAFEDLPHPLATQTRRVITDSYPTPLRTSARLDEPVMVDLTIPPRSVQQEHAEEGRLRLLAHAQITAQGQVRLKLLPQNHRHRTVVKPRDPREDVFDGRVYEAIGVGFTLAPDEVLVVGLYWPPRDQEQPQGQDEPASEPRGDEVAPDVKPDAQEPSTDSQQAVAPTDAPQPEGDETTTASWKQQREREAELASLPRHFGRVLMTTERGNQPAQVLLLISAQPFHHAQSRRNSR